MTPPPEPGPVRAVAVLLAASVLLDLVLVPVTTGTPAPGSIAAALLPLVAAWVLWRGRPHVWVLPGLGLAATLGALAVAGLPALAVAPDPDVVALATVGGAALLRAAVLPVALPPLRQRLADDPPGRAAAVAGAAGAVVLAAAAVVDVVGPVASGTATARALAGPLLASLATALVLLGLATIVYGGRDRAAVLGVLAALVVVAVPTLGTVLALDRGGFAVSTGTWLRLGAALPLVAALLLEARRGPPGPRPGHPPAPV